jgi:hypothetical protein
MTKIKASIIKTLKEFEQQDYKRGGVSISPEIYYAIADKIYRELIKPEKVAKKHFRKQRDNGLIELQDRKDAGY